MIKLLGTGMGRSCTSIDKPNKDEFWDGMTNPAMDASKEDISGGIQDKEKVVEIVSSPPGGPSSIPLTSIKGKVCQTRRPRNQFYRTLLLQLATIPRSSLWEAPVLAETTPLIMIQKMIPMSARFATKGLKV